MYKLRLDKGKEGLTCFKLDHISFERYGCVLAHKTHNTRTDKGPTHFILDSYQDIRHLIISKFISIQNDRFRYVTHFLEAQLLCN